MSAADILTAEECEALAQMFRNLAIAGVVGFCSLAHGASGDKWGDENVKKHLIGEAVIATVVTVATDSRAVGLTAALAAGACREDWKRRHGFASWSQSRIAADVAGSVIGAQLGHCVIADKSLACAWKF